MDDGLAGREDHPDQPQARHVSLPLPWGRPTASGRLRGVLQKGETMIAKPKPLRAAVYIRMSDRSQDASPEQQQTEAVKLAGREGCEIVRWYDKDLAISGDATERRKDFQRMIADAERGAFDVIICWDQDRFGRFDSIEAGRWIFPLRQAGVRLLTVGQGWIDWTSFAGRLIYSVQQEGKNQYLVDLSRNVCRGRLAAMRAGRVPPPATYGYDRLFLDQAGNVVKRVPYGERFTKPKGWTAKLVPAEDGTAEIVRSLFRAVADEDSGIRTVIADLTARGVPGPKQRDGWCWSGVEYILRNPTYAGTRAQGRHANGKYHRIGDDAEVVKGNGRREFTHRDTPLFVKHDAHPALIDRDTFERVQRRLDERRLHKEKPRDNGYLLRGVLFCGHCGGKLYGSPGGKRTADGGYTLRYYVCERGATQGKAACQKYAIRQDHLEKYILGLVAEVVMNPEATGQVIEAVRRQAGMRGRQEGQLDPADLTAKIRALDAKIAKGAENALLADAGSVPELTRVLDGWRRERARLQESLDAAARGNVKDIDALADRAVAELTRLRRHLETGEPAKVRQVVRAMIERVTLWWEPKPSGKRYRLSRGIVAFRECREMSGAAH